MRDFFEGLGCYLAWDSDANPERRAWHVRRYPPLPSNAAEIPRISTSPSQPERKLNEASRHLRGDAIAANFVKWQCQAQARMLLASGQGKESSVRSVPAADSESGMRRALQRGAWE